MRRTVVRPASGPSQGPAIERTSTGPDIRERLSVVVPVTERADQLIDIHREFAARLEAAGEDFEFLFVFDGRHARIPVDLRRLAREDERIRLLVLAGSQGETPALRAGIEHSEGGIIVTVPAVFEVEPAAVSTVLDKLRGSPDVVVASRSRPKQWLRGLQSRLFWLLARAATGTTFTDMSCGLRGMRREVALALPLRGSAHRFFPAVAAREGYRVEEFEAARHGREPRESIRSPAEYVGILLDLLAFAFVSRFTDRPLRFFGAVGSALAIGGLLTGVWLTLERFALDKGIANRPLLLLAVLLVAVGVQVIGLGLVGEIIVSHRASEGRRYRVLDVG